MNSYRLYRKKTWYNRLLQFLCWLLLLLLLLLLPGLVEGPV